MGWDGVFKPGHFSPQHANGAFIPIVNSHHKVILA